MGRSCRLWVRPEREDVWLEFEDDPSAGSSPAVRRTESPDLDSASKQAWIATAAEECLNEEEVEKGGVQLEKRERRGQWRLKRRRRRRRHPIESNKHYFHFFSTSIVFYKREIQSYRKVAGNNAVATFFFFTPALFAIHVSCNGQLF